MTFSIVMTTCANTRDAGKISDMLLRQRSAACVKFSEVSSSYWWNGKVKKSHETLLTILTQKKNVAKVMATIKRLHKYETPEIIEVPIRRGDKKYFRWVCDVTV